MQELLQQEFIQIEEGSRRGGGRRKGFLVNAREHGEVLSATAIIRASSQHILLIPFINLAECFP